MSASKERHKYAPIHQAETKDEDVDLKQFDIEKPADGHSYDVARVQVIEVDQENMAASTKKQGLNMEKWKRFILAWVSIILAILAGASIGPAFKYMSRHGIRSCLSASWRCQCMLIFLLPIAVLEVVADKNKRVDWFARKPDLKYPVIVHVFFSGLAWAGNLLTWIVGLQYTTTFKASLIACSHPLMLALFLLFRGDKVSWMGLFGILVSFSGLIISNLPDLFNDSGRAEDGSKLTWAEQALGIFLCLLAAACEVIVLFNRIVTQKYVPLMQYTFATTIVVALGATLASIFLEGTGIIHSAAVTDEYGRPIPQTIEIFCLQDNCIFGWMAKKVGSEDSYVWVAGRCRMHCRL
jgi:drug/metabolite transporter (DMT)-like permease